MTTTGKTVGKTVTGADVSIFDLRERFEEKCRPILNELILICGLEGIPIFFSACVENDKEHSEYVNDMVAAGSRGIILTDDQIARHMQVCAGFEPVEPGMILELSEEELSID